MPLHAGTSPRQQRLLAIINHYAIGDNPDPAGLFAFGISRYTIWCIPSDHPGGVWDQFAWRANPMSQLTKQAAVGLARGMLLYAESAQDSIGFTLQTHARALSDTGLIARSAIENRPEDVAWATRKLVWLWAQAFPDESAPSIQLTWDRDQPKEDFSDIV